MEKEGKGVQETGGEIGKDKVQKLITKYTKTSATAKPRAPGPPPARRGRSRAGGTTAVGRGAGGKKVERKGNQRFLEMWLKDGGGDRGVWRSPESAREVWSAEKEGSQEGREKAGGSKTAPPAEEGRSPQEGKEVERTPSGEISLLTETQQSQGSKGHTN